MSVVKWIRKKSRLSQLVDQPGGMTVRKAMEQAQENLSTIRDDCLTAVVEAVTSLEALVLKTPTDEGAWLDEVYRLASCVLDSVGPFEMEDVSNAAFSLCDLADRLRSSGRNDQASIQVHVRALRLLLQLPKDAVDGRREVLDGLERVVARFPKPAA